MKQSVLRIPRPAAARAMSTYSIRQIKESHRERRDYDRQFPVSFFLVRPLSFYTTYLLLRITESPSGVAYGGLLTGLAACAALLFSPELSLWPGFAILILFVLLDASDGNIARVTDRVSHYGRFLDGVVGEIVEGGYFFCLGLGMYRTTAEFVLPAALGVSHESARFLVPLSGMIAALGRMYSNRIVATYYLYRQRKYGAGENQEDGEPALASRYLQSGWYLLFLNVGSTDLQVLLLGLCAMVHLVEGFLFFYAAYYLFQAIFFTGFYLRRARKVLS